MKSFVSIVAATAILSTAAFCDETTEPSYSGYRYIPTHTQDGAEITGDTTLRELGKIAYIDGRIVSERNKSGIRGFFLGLEAGLTGTQQHIKVRGDNEADLGVRNLGGRLAGEFGANLGMNFNDNHRVYLGYRWQMPSSFIDSNINIDTSAHKILLGYDYLWRSFNENRAFVGLYGGYARAESEVDDPTGQSGSSTLGFNQLVLGVNLGHTFKAYKGNEFEVGIRTEYAHSAIRHYEGNTYKARALNLGLFGRYNFNFDF